MAGCPRPVRTIALTIRKSKFMSKMMRSITGGALLLFSGALCAQTLQNADFEATTGSWPSDEGPPGWTLNLGSDDQLGLVESPGFVEPGSNAFRFNQVASGFGSSRLEQCLALDDPMAIQLSTWVRTQDPHPELVVRLRMDFYADTDCQTDSSAADNEQVQSDISLNADRAPAGEWVRIASEIRLGSELGDDVQSVRVSLRQRDRSDGGQPRDPARTVWFDRVSTEADVQFLPAAQRAALRDLYLATDGDNWLDALGWMEAEGTECRWQGVECADDGESLVRLSLPRNRLLGELPDSLSELTELLPGEGLDLCWNDVLVPEGLQAFVDSHHLGGDPGHCQGLELEPIHAGLTGSYFQPDDRYGEGFLLHMLSAGSALLMWANYNDAGEPIWIIASGRARDRVLHFNDLYHTRIEAGETEIERIGRASLAFVADADRPGCSSAVLRFQADGSGFGAGSGRELQYLDGLSDCVEGPETLSVLRELEGHWFDPEQSGQGLSLIPISGNALWLNWFGYDDQGRQIWQAGAGWPDDAGERILFEPLYTVSGGNFNDFMGPDDLNIEFLAPAELAWVDGRWQFEASWQGEPVSLRLHPVEAGPDLLAATGNRIDLSMDPADLEELYTRSIWSDERLPGQVRFNGQDQVHELTGLRFRGNSSRMVPKKSYNIRFEQAQPLLFGSDRMNLNAMYTDPTMMRESISFQMFHELGQPAPLTRYFDLWINDIYEGTYIHIQRVDERLLELNGLNPGGTLVRDQTRGNGDLDVGSIFATDLSQIDPDERLDFIIENFDYRNDPHWNALLELVEWVQASQPGPTFEAEFEQRIDIENFIDWMLVHWLVGDIDAWGDDYWLYLDHDDPEARWMFIPWDKDLSFGSHYRAGFFTDNDFFAYEYSLSGGSENTLLQKALSTPGIRARIDQRLIELMTEYFDQPWFGTQIAHRFEWLADSISIQPGPQAFERNERNHHSTETQLEDQLEALVDFVELRQAFIQRQLVSTSGSEDQADGELAIDSTTKLMLTDATGFTIASIEPQQGFASTMHFEIEVQPAPGLVGIDREWQLTIEGDSSDTVSLTLYYRNEILSWLGRGNWWTEGDEPIGQQTELVMEVSGPNGQTEALPTRINPISNKAVAELELGPGSYQFRLQLP